MESQSIRIRKFLTEGTPTKENFEIVKETLNVDQNALDKSIPENGLLVKALVFSADPYLISTIKSVNSFSNLDNTKKLGDPVEGFVAGKILFSKNPNWKEGDLFGASLPFATVQIVDENKLKQTAFWKLTDIISEENISYGIGILGMPGSTAYGGLFHVLAAKEGETIFISGAAGAVGGYVGQLAKQILNCTVIGSCGGPEKCELIKTKFGFDHAIDYKTASDRASLTAALKAVAPKGIDLYFDNVGGYHLEAAFDCLRPRGRIAVCGGISQYTSKEAPRVSINALQMIYTNQRIEGFLCSEYLMGAKGNFLKDVAKWVQEGKLHIQETYFDGIENWPEAFHSLFVGGNSGKVVVRL